MRIKKVSGLTLQYIDDDDRESGFYDENPGSNNPTTRYFYDGQMGMEEDLTVASPASHTVTRYGLGARGIDLIQNLAWSGSTLSETSLSFPLYDGHGNMISTIARSGTAFAKANGREYDPWGVNRSGAASGDPAQRYCANLGHRSDDESGLTYMRARFYEASTGRFISEDPAMDGFNWFTYCDSSPTNFLDQDGRRMNPIGAGIALGWATYFLFKFYQGDSSDTNRALRYFGTTVAAIGLGFATPSIESWILRAASRVAAVLRLDRLQRPGQLAYNWTKNDTRIAFYVGYSVFLVFTMEYLEAWANGEAE